jgi:divalent metal cation (Fe/Co/Zn/Cd) transporter
VLAISLCEPAVSEVHDITTFEHGDQVSVSLHLKLPAESSLQQGHVVVAERVEDAIRKLPGVSDALTHLEPLERPIAADPTATYNDREILETVRRFFGEQTGTAARDVRGLPTDAGIVLFIIVPVSATESLARAHQIASELEEVLRQQIPEIADVVVHTEPCNRPPRGVTPSRSAVPSDRPEADDGRVRSPVGTLRDPPTPLEGATLPNGSSTQPARLPTFH